MSRLEYSGKLILAPMVKIGTTPTRLLALEYGADIVYTEEIIDWRILRCQRLRNELLNTIDYIDKTDSTLVLRIADKERGKLVLQIGTCDPERASKVAKIVENDVDGIDVNMGCPKSFSLKGGMGAALLTQPDKIKSILTSLVAAVSIPITCKIRILPNLEDTIALVKMIETTGVAAIGVHGRTKDERPNHPNHVEIIQEVVKHAKLPIIANGGSSNNRESAQNTYEGIKQFWAESGASSVMVARAAEWNTSVFMPCGKKNVYEVISRYLDYAIDYDYTYIVVKYNVQQLLGSDQETPKGRKFLSCSTMTELCSVFDKEKQYIEKQEFFQSKKRASLKEDQFQTNMVKRSYREVLPSDVLPIPVAKKLRLCDLDPETFPLNNQEVIEMLFPYVRKHYTNNNDGSAVVDIPKALLYNWTKKLGTETPVYQTWEKDKMFRSVVTVQEQRFSSESWEKNKRFSEQAAALVALHYLGIKKFKMAEVSYRNENRSDESKV